MAVRLNASGEYLARTANLPLTTAFSICGWSTITSDRNTFVALAALWSASLEVILTTDGDGTSLAIYNQNSFSAVLATLTVGTPFFWGLAGSGANTFAYFRLATSNTLSSVTHTATSTTPTNLRVGNNQYDEWHDGRTWNVKCWDRTLSASEFLVESYFQRVMYPQSLNFHWPLSNAADVADRSGNGRNPTVSGTLTTEDSVVNLWRPRRRMLRQASAGGGTQDLAAAGAAQASGSAALSLAKTLAADALATAAGGAALQVVPPAVDLAAAGAAQASSSAALLKGVSLAAAGLASASGSASVGHGVPLQASAAAVATAGAQLAVAVSLGAAGLASAAAAAGLVIGKPLAAAAAAQAGGTATLSTTGDIELAAAAAAQASGGAVLSLVISLSGAAVAQALASAALAAGKPLGAVGTAQADATAALQVGNAKDLAAGGTAQASAGASLQLTVPLSAAALAQAVASGSLLLTVPLSASALAQASGSAEFGGDVQMSAQGVSVATASALLQVTGPYARAPDGWCFADRFFNTVRAPRVHTGARPSSSTSFRPPR